MTSAFICGSAQIVVLRSAAPDGPAAGGALPRHRPRGGDEALHLLLEFAGECFGVGVVQITYLRVAARFRAAYRGG